MFKWFKEWKEKRKKKKQNVPAGTKGIHQMRAYSTTDDPNLYQMEPIDSVPQALMHAAMFGHLQDGTPVNTGDTLDLPEGRFHVRSADHDMGSILFDRLDDEPKQDTDYSPHTHHTTESATEFNTHTHHNSDDHGSNHSSHSSNHDYSSDNHHSSYDSSYHSHDYSSSHDSGSSYDSGSSSYDSGSSSCDSSSSCGGWD